MIFDLSKGYVPESYSESRDYRVFLKLLGILLTVYKDNTDSLVSLYSSDDCPADLLPNLAHTVGYRYDDSLSVENNRIIIKYYPYLIRNRGSEEGIKLATALSLNTSISASSAYSVDSIVVDIDYTLGRIKVYYPHTNLIKQELIEVVRPAGMSVELVPSAIGSVTDIVDVRAHVKYESGKYNPDRGDVGSQVGFANVSLEEESPDE